MFKRILGELGEHMPFTAIGAVSGIIIMVIIMLTGILPHLNEVSYMIFYILHPSHVILSALVTTALYKKYGKYRIWAVLLVGYLGSVGIGTLSDSLIPYLGEVLLALPNRGLHIGFIEEWWVVNPAALVGIAIGYWKPATKLPHSAHVLISTWASLFHVIMALGTTMAWYVPLIIFIFLFLGVWLPCCLSDIVFPLIFVREKLSPH